MNSEKKVTIKCWSCQKKFTIPAQSGTTITIYKGTAPSPKPEPKKTRLLKTCPYCGKDNEIEL
ncbi:Uncharacterised protein [uncultured archaeon]|nr:Uncharacterised protein [uncultured archaeon]